MKKRKILITLEISEDQKKVFMDDVNEFTFKKQADLTEKDIDLAQIIIGNVPLKLIDHITKLEYIHLFMAGSDNFANHPMIKDKVLLTNSTGCFGLAISEHMLGNVLFFYKKLNLYYNNQLHAKWHAEGDIKSIYGANVLVIGLGDIGNNFAQRMYQLGAKVIGIKRTAGQKPDYLDHLYQMDKLDACLKEADIVALSLPNSPETFHIINKDRLALLKHDALLINVGRGTAVDSEALYNSLSANPELHAALDVFEEEPLPASSKLWQLPNILITPHISGARNLAYTNQKLLELAAANLKAYLNNEPLTNVVDYKTGYRKSN